MRISDKNFKSALNLIVPENKKLLIAISGGIDSMVLMDLCSKNIPLNQLHCIHINHNLTDQANEYEDLVVHRCMEKKISLIVKSEKRSDTKGESMEMWGRRIRYRNYFKTLNRVNFDYILTAHHADDNIETILMNIDRGCSPRGLRGIIPKNGKIIRPMLIYKKSDVIKYAKNNNIDYVYDLSNNDTAIKRNYIRKFLVPKLIEKNNLIVKRFSELSRTAQNVIFKEKVIMQHLASKIKIDLDSSYHLNDSDLLNFSTYFKIRLIKEILGESELPWRRHKYDLLRNFFVKSKTGSKLEINNKWMFLRDRNKWILYKNRSKKIKINIDEFGSYNFNDITISLKKTEKRNFDNNINSELIDFDIIKKKHIQIRSWANGDKFQPLGMKGSKKVSDYFIDKKIDNFNKESQLVLTAGDDIIWICGQRLSDKVKITNSTTNIMELSLFK